MRGHFWTASILPRNLRGVDRAQEILPAEIGCRIVTPRESSVNAMPWCFKPCWIYNITRQQTGSTTSVPLRFENLGEPTALRCLSLRNGHNFLLNLCDRCDRIYVQYVSNEGLKDGKRRLYVTESSAKQSKKLYPKYDHHCSNKANAQKKLLASSTGFPREILLLEGNEGSVSEE